MSSRSNLEALSVCLVAITAAASPRPAQADDFVVRDVRVFDGKRVIPRTDVVVRGGRIESVGGKAKADGLAVVDGTGRTLIPGLIDAHTHTYGAAQKDALRFGVTTELDMFTDWHLLEAARRQRASLERTDRADLWSAGTLATAPHGHGTEYGLPIPTVAMPSEAQPFVDARLAEGSDYLKVILEDGSSFARRIPTLDVPTLDALVAAAHRRGRLALAHVSTRLDALHAVDAGIDGLAHVFVDRRADAATVASLRTHRTFVVPTLSVIAVKAGAAEGAKLATDARVVPFLSADQVRMLNASFPIAPARAGFLADATASVARLHAAGVPLLAGTDAGNPGTTHGATLHQELALLVGAGLTPSEALNAATALPARLFALGDRGRIVAGQRADLVLVDGDPTRDIAATRDIVTIWKNGYAVDRTVPLETKGADASRAAPTDATNGTTATTATTAATTDPMISDFEDGTLATRYGRPWNVATDGVMGGRSTATQTWIAAGADGSKGALRIEGTIADGTPFPWAGTLFMPGATPFEAVDHADRQVLVFKVRGDGRENVAMLFSGPPDNGRPVFATFGTAAEWSEVRIPLARFEGADLARLRGLAFTAGSPAGPFWFEIDDVSIR